MVLIAEGREFDPPLSYFFLNFFSLHIQLVLSICILQGSCELLLLGSHHFLLSDDLQSDVLVTLNPARVSNVQDKVRGNSIL